MTQKEPKTNPPAHAYFGWCPGCGTRHVSMDGAEATCSDCGLEFLMPPMTLNGYGLADRTAVMIKDFCTLPLGFVLIERPWRDGSSWIIWKITKDSRGSGWSAHNGLYLNDEAEARARWDQIKRKHTRYCRQRLAALKSAGELEVSA